MLGLNKTKKKPTRKISKSRDRAGIGRLSQRRSLLFALAFGLVGLGGLAASFAYSDNMIPDRPDELILSYNPPHVHEYSEAGAVPHTGSNDQLELLLYGDGRLICAPPGSEEIRERRLSRPAVRSFVNRIVALGFERLPAQAKKSPDMPATFGQGTFIRLNSSRGSVTKAHFSGPKPASFRSIETFLTSECTKSRDLYESDKVVVTATETSSASSRGEQVVNLNSSNAPVNINSLIKDRVAAAETRLSRLTGQLRNRLARQGKAKARINNQLVELKSTPLVPSFKTPMPKHALGGGSGKVSAQTPGSVRFLYVYSTDQSKANTPTRTALEQVQKIKKNVVEYYQGQIGKTLNVTEVKQVTGKHNSYYYRTNCPAKYGDGCKVEDRETGIVSFSPTLAIQRNMYEEFNVDNVITLIIFGFNTTQPEGKCKAWGTIGSTNSSGGVGTVSMQLCNWDLAHKTVPSHEVGHNLSLEHSCSNNNLMSGYNKRLQCEGFETIDKPAWPTNFPLDAAQKNAIKNSAFFGSGSTPPSNQQQNNSNQGSTSMEYKVERQGRCTGESHTSTWLGTRVTNPAHQYDVVPVLDTNRNGVIDGNDGTANHLKKTRIKGGDTDKYVWWKNKLIGMDKKKELWGVKAYRWAGSQETRTKLSGSVWIGPCFKVDLKAQCLPNGKGRFQVRVNSPRNNTSFDVRLLREGDPRPHYPYQGTSSTLSRIREGRWYNLPDVPASWVRGKGTKFAVRVYEWSAPGESAGGQVDTDKTGVKTLGGCEKDNSTGSASVNTGGNTGGNTGSSDPVPSSPSQNRFSVTYADARGNVRTGTTNYINHNWGSGSPISGIDKDNFIIAWSGTFKAPATGTYTFYAVHDDGFIMNLNGVTVMDNWAAGKGQAIRSVSLKKGQTLKVDVAMYDLTGGSYAALRWSGPGLTGIPVFPATNQSTFDFN